VEATPELLVCLDVAAAFIDEADNEVADVAEVIEAFAVDEAVAIVAVLCRLASCSSIVVGDDMASTTKAVEQHEAKRQSTATMATASSTAKASMTSATSATSLSASSIKAAATSKQTKSSGVASTVVQSDGQEAAIQAVTTDKFASSLRESAGVQIGVQKDLSVIDAHRRQSMQQQQSHGHQGSHHHPLKHKVVFESRLFINSFFSLYVSTFLNSS
jgi:hypothetical protein